MRNGLRWLPCGLVFVFFLGLLSGCVRSRYHYGTGDSTSYEPLLVGVSPGNPIAIGGDRPGIDRLEAVVRAPLRLLGRLSHRRDKPQQDPETLREEALGLSQRYLSANGLHDVYIDIRRYEPAEQWARLRANDRISPIWKYTGGSLGVAAYTLLPQRALHIDRYSPFTNTLSLNSTRPTRALYQAGIAKEHHKHRWPGAYAMLQRAPIFPVIHNWHVASDVLTYARANECWEIEKQLYPTAYAKITSAVVANVMYFAPVPPGTPQYVAPVTRVVLGRVGALTGRAVAHREASNREASAAAEATR